MQPIRHGDVLLFPIKSLPKAEIIEHDGTFTIALGEVTGHHHTLYSQKENMTVSKVGDKFFVHLSVDTPLRHQEHKEIVIPKGSYAVGWETERDPFLDELRKAQD